MFHRVTTEEQKTETTETQDTNTRAAPATPKTEERALYTEQERKSSAAQPQQNTVTSKTESQQPTERKPADKGPQKVKYTPHISRTSTYSTSKINRGTKPMTSYSPTPAQDTSNTETAKTHDFSAGSYNRNHSARPSTGYPGASRAPASSTNTDTDRTLTIGAGITMAGEIESCDYLLVEGTVEAALKGARSLEVAESGVFYGTVEIEDATIAGRFEGDITVHGRLTIQSSGIVTGSITYKELEIESGAIVDGRLTPVAATAQGGIPAPVQTKTRVTAKATTAESANEDAANSDADLFTGDATTAAE